MPPPLLGLATEFRQGEALVAGKIGPDPDARPLRAALVGEGGADVPSDWAARRD